MVRSPEVIEGDDASAGEQIPERAKPRWIIISVIAVVAAGVAMRVWILSSSMGALESDEAVVGLMARRLLQGEFSTYYWGQKYGGTPEVVFVAALFKLFGSSVVVLKLAPILLSATAPLLVWRVGRRTVKEPSATVAALFTWTAPAYSVWWSTHEHLFYWNTIVLGLVIFLAALRIVQGDGSWPAALAIGLAAGIGWWASPMIVYFAAPAGLWLLFRLRRRALLLLWAIPSFVAGAAPSLVESAKHGLTLFDLPPQPVANGYIENLRAFASRGLPAGLGLRMPFSGEWIPRAAGPVLFIALIVFVGWRARRLGRDSQPILLAAALFPFIFAASPLSWFVAEPRYLTLLVPIVALLLAWAFLGRQRSLAVPFMIVTLALSTTTLVWMDRRDMTTVTAPDVKMPERFGPLVALLDDSGIRRVYANYWIAYRLMFETNERIIARPYVASRYPPYSRAVERAPAIAYVLLRGSRSVDAFEQRFRSIGVRYRKTGRDDFVLLIPDRNVRPWKLVPLPAGEE
jgi:hypothetical protein